MPREIGDALAFIRARRRQAIGRVKSAPPEVLELDGLVLQLVDEGRTYRQIAEELAARFGGRPVTKQAVHQRVKRLALAAQGEGMTRRRG